MYVEIIASQTCVIFRDTVSVGAVELDISNLIHRLSMTVTGVGPVLKTSHPQRKNSQSCDRGGRKQALGI